MITKMKKLTFLIYHKDYECFLQNIRDLGVVHVAEKAQGTAENTELQESIRLSDHYASTIKFLQGFNVELQEQKGEYSPWRESVGGSGGVTTGENPVAASVADLRQRACRVRGMGRFRSCVGYAVARSWISGEFLYLLREEL